MHVRREHISALIARAVLAIICVAHQLPAQLLQASESRLTPTAVVAEAPTQRSDAQNRCIGRAISGGLIIAVGSFLGLKILNSGPFADNSPPSDGVVLAISVVAGTGYVLWKSRRCEQVHNALPGTTLPPARRKSAFSSNPVGFDYFERLIGSTGFRTHRSMLRWR